MTIYLIDALGKAYVLENLLSWKFSYGFMPCSSFEISFMYNKEMLEILEKACRFKAYFQGECVFSGLIDEFIVVADEKNFSVSLNGRSLMALLLDNQAEACEYYSLSLEELLNIYVRPFGIYDIQMPENPPRLPLKVSSGQSCYKVLENYMWFALGRLPYFSHEGKLILDGQGYKTFELSSPFAVSSQKLSYKRYGVISEVIVQNKVLGIEEKLTYEEFLDKGGCARRIMTVPRTSSFDDMKSTAEYKIKASKQEEFSLSFIIPQMFAAYPLDIIRLVNDELGISGEFQVLSSCSFGDFGDCGTEITLVKRGT